MVLLKAMKRFADRYEFNRSRSELKLLCRRHAPLDIAPAELIGTLLSNGNHLRLKINRNDVPEVRRHGNGDTPRSTSEIKKKTLSGRSGGSAQMREKRIGIRWAVGCIVVRRAGKGGFR